jgi:hypothetical protein
MSRPPYAVGDRGLAAQECATDEGSRPPFQLDRLIFPDKAGVSSGSGRPEAQGATFEEYAAESGHFPFGGVLRATGERNRQAAGGGRPVEWPRPHLRLPMGASKCGKSRRVPLWWDGGTLANLAAWRATRLAQKAKSTDPFVASLQPDRTAIVFSRRTLRKRFRTAYRTLGAERLESLTSPSRAPHVYQPCAGVRADAGRGARRGGSFEHQHHERVPYTWRSMMTRSGRCLVKLSSQRTLSPSPLKISGTAPAKKPCSIASSPCRRATHFKNYH